MRLTEKHAQLKYQAKCLTENLFQMSMEKIKAMEMVEGLRAEVEWQKKIVDAKIDLLLYQNEEMERLEDEVCALAEIAKELVLAAEDGAGAYTSDFCSHGTPCSSIEPKCYAQKIYAVLDKAKPLLVKYE